MNSRTLLVPSFLVLALIAGCNGQEAAWEEAREADTVAAYEEFLEEQPESPQAQVAQQRMRALQRTERWRQVSETDSMEAHQQFLSEFPQGPESEQARNRIAELEREQEWERLRGSNDLGALRAFAEQHRGEPLGDQAMQRVEQLQAQTEADARARREEEERRRAEEASRTHRVQLAAYQSQQRADQGASTLEEQLSDVLGGTGLEVTQSGSYYLLATQPMSEEDARSLCNTLQENDQECVVITR